MSHWNYRVMTKKKNNEVQFAFYEVYYNDDDEPDGYSQNSIEPISIVDNIEDPIESLKWQLNAMILACEKPVLDYDMFPKVYVKHLRKSKLIKINKILNK